MKWLERLEEIGEMLIWIKVKQGVGLRVQDTTVW